MNKSLKVGIALGGLVVVVGLVSFSLFGEDVQETEFFTTEVALGSIQNTVSATGTVEPVVTVQVGSQVSGQIETLYADFNSVVSAGQLLAKLDPRTFESTLANSRASLVSANSRVTTAEADLTNARASMASSLASLEASRVDSDKAAIQFRRAEEMKAVGLISETDFDNAKATADAAAARVKQSEASIDQGEAQIVSREAGIEQAKSSVIQAEADVSRSEINLEYTNIYSPVDGVVISREVDVGQTVAASMSAPTLFLIANDLSLMRVNASIDEADIGKLSQSNQIGFTVDAYPGERFRGFIEEIRLSPSTSQNVVTYSVIIGVNNEDLKLKPGMTANITVTVDRRDGVLSVPNAALRYRPPGEEDQPLQPARGGGDGGGRSGRGGGRGAAAQTESPEDSPIPAEPEQVADSGRRERGGRGVGPGSQGERRGGGEGAGRGGRGQGRQARGGRRPGGFPSAPGTGGAQFSGGDIRSAAPGQLWDAGEKLQFSDAPPVRPRQGRVWVLTEAGVPELRNVTLGITDGARSELMVSDLQEGDMVIIGDSSQGDDGQTQQGFNPFGGFGASRGGRGRR
jgi:HlyD family secretion protein